MEVQTSPLCSKRAPSLLLELADHIRTICNDDEPATKRFKSENTYECTFCFEVYSDINLRNDHMKIQHPQSPIIDELNNLPEDEDEYEYNPNIMEPICELMQDEDDSVIRCKTCERSFEFSGDLAKHVRSHTLNKPFQCSICANTFESLNTHLLIHSGERPYKCQQCFKAFTQSSSLTVHMRSHTVQKPFTCDVCDKGFVNSSSLILHEQAHDKGDPFPCIDCGKGFKHSHLLADHMRLHRHKSVSMFYMSASIRANQ